MVYKDVKINESVLTDNKGNKGKVAIFFYTGQNDPVESLNGVIRKYTEGCNRNEYGEFVEIGLNNPWCRVIVSNMDNMEFDNFNEFMKPIIKARKIKKLIKNSKK